MKKVTFIGGGNMAFAIINGILKSGFIKPSDITVCDICSEKLLSFSEKGINTSSVISDSLKGAEVVFLAVKPQNFPEVLSEIKPLADGKVFVTIAAGISSDYINKTLGENYPVIRVMPNTPLLLGVGASAISKNEFVDDDIFDFAVNIFKASGTVEIIDESKMNTIISVNGSSPAYIYLFAKAMSDYAVKEGIDFDTAMSLICATLKGSAEMLLKSGDTPDELIKKVSSPGGTTLKALEKLNEGNFCQNIIDAMDACTKRAEELGK